MASFMLATPALPGSPFIASHGVQSASSLPGSFLGTSSKASSRATTAGLRLLEDPPAEADLVRMECGLEEALGVAWNGRLDLEAPTAPQQDLPQVLLGLPVQGRFPDQPALELLQIGAGDLPEPAPLTDLRAMALDGRTFPWVAVQTLGISPDLARDEGHDGPGDFLRRHGKAALHREVIQQQGEPQPSRPVLVDQEFLLAGYSSQCSASSASVQARFMGRPP